MKNVERKFIHLWRENWLHSAVQIGQSLVSFYVNIFCRPTHAVTRFLCVSWIFLMFYKIANQFDFSSVWSYEVVTRVNPAWIVGCAVVGRQTRDNVLIGSAHQWKRLRSRVTKASDMIARCVAVSTVVSQCQIIIEVNLQSSTVAVTDWDRRLQPARTAALLGWRSRCGSALRDHSLCDVIRWCPSRTIYLEMTSFQLPAIFWRDRYLTPQKRGASVP